MENSRKYERGSLWLLGQRNDCLVAFFFAVWPTAGLCDCCVSPAENAVSLHSNCRALVSPCWKRGAQGHGSPSKMVSSCHISTRSGDGSLKFLSPSGLSFSPILLVRVNPVSWLFYVTMTLGLFPSPLASHWDGHRKMSALTIQQPNSSAHKVGA